MKMRAIEIVISGPKVVEVGYRPFLLLNAMNYRIDRFFAYNVAGAGSMAVVARVQGPEEKINQYVDFVRSNFPAHAKVDGLEVRDFEGEVMDASVFLQLLQFEQINKAIPAILSIDKKQDIMIEKQGLMLDKQDIMIEKQGLMLDKQDQNLAVLEGVRENTSAIKKDVSTLAKQTTLEDLEKKYDLLSREIAEIRADISDIKAI